VFNVASSWVAAQLRMARVRRRSSLAAAALAQTAGGYCAIMIIWTWRSACNLALRKCCRYARAAEAGVGRGDQDRARQEVMRLSSCVLSDIAPAQSFSLDNPVLGFYSYGVSLF
jgi:hypothetical protein